jgi:hypothetical protein
MTITYGPVRARIADVRGQEQTSAVAIRLRRDAVMRLAPTRHGMKVHDEAGTLWLTQEGDPDDHVLEAGDTFETKRTGALVVQAISGEATVRISE